METNFHEVYNDVEKAVIAAVNLGKDNDSSAGIVGSLIGSRIGASNLPKKWVEIVENSNKEFKIHETAEKLTNIIFDKLCSNLLRG